MMAKLTPPLLLLGLLAASQAHAQASPAPAPRKPASEAASPTAAQPSAAASPAAAGKRTAAATGAAPAGEPKAATAAPEGGPAAGKPATPPPPTGMPTAARPQAAAQPAQQSWPTDASPSAATVARSRRPGRGDAGAPYAVAFTVERRWNDDPGYDAFAGDDLSARLGIWLAYDVLMLSPEVVLAAEAGFAAETDEASELLGGALHSKLEGYAPHIGAQARWRMLSWLQPHVRLQGGATIWNTQIDLGRTEVDNDGVAPFGRITAGLLLRTPTRLFENSRGHLASMSFGLLLEGGFALEAPWQMELDVKGPGEDDIPIAEASLGELSRSGPFVQGSVVGRF
jgi:hypothetical protein